MADQVSLQLVDTDNNVWALILDKARTLVKSGLLPQEIRTAEACAAIILKGQELRLPAMYSLSNIHIIKGKPTCSAELMLALIYRDHGDMAIRFKETSGTNCKIEYRRRAWPDASTHSFTMAEATTAGLTTNDNWRKYPGAMLRARCLSAVARMAFPDSIGGMFTPEEMGANVRIDGDVVVYDGEIVEAESRIVERQELPAEAPNRQPATTAESVQPESPDPPAAQTAIARLHAIAAKISIDHKGIHDLAVSIHKVKHTDEMTGRMVYAMEQLLKDPGKAHAELEMARQKPVGGTSVPDIIDIDPTIVDSPINFQADDDRRGDEEVIRTGQPATSKQLQFISAIARELNLSDESLHLEAQSSFGAEIADLTRRDASILIERLQQRRQQSSRPISG